MKLALAASSVALLVLGTSIVGPAQARSTNDDCHHRGAFEGGVFRIGGSIQPPVPLYTPLPVRPEGTPSAGAPGIVSLSVVVDVTGCPVFVTVARSLDSAIDEAAVNAVRNWRFQPATLDGKRVRVWITVQVRFGTSKTAEFTIINSKSP